MIEDMYTVMQRIDDIQKRFGLKKNKNTQKEEVSAETEDFSVSLQKFLEQNKGETLSHKDKINGIAEFYAKKNNLSPALIKAVINVESGYDETAVSPKGAMGLMQLMPGTAKELGVQDPFSPSENIRAGTVMLRDLLNKYNGNYELALAAYNAGPGAVDRHGGIPEYKETKQYVKKVLKSYEANK